MPRWLESRRSLLFGGIRVLELDNVDCPESAWNVAAGILAGGMDIYH